MASTTLLLNGVFGSFLGHVSVSIANVFVLILLRPKVLDSVAEHLLCIILLKHEEESRVLALNDHLLYHQVRIIGYHLSVLIHYHGLLGCSRGGQLDLDW